VGGSEETAWTGSSVKGGKAVDRGDAEGDSSKKRVTEQNLSGMDCNPTPPGGTGDEIDGGRKRLR